MAALLQLLERDVGSLAPHRVRRVFAEHVARRGAHEKRCDAHFTPLIRVVVTAERPRVREEAVVLADERSAVARPDPECGHHADHRSRRMRIALPLPRLDRSMVVEGVGPLGNVRRLFLE